MKRSLIKTVGNWRWWIVLPLAVVFLPVGIVGLLLQKLPRWIEAVSDGYETAAYPIRRMFDHLALWAFAQRTKKDSP